MALRTSIRHWVRESSVTAFRPQIASCSSLWSRDGRAARSACEALQMDCGRSLTSFLFLSSAPRSMSSVKSPNKYIGPL